VKQNPAYAGGGDGGVAGRWGQRELMWLVYPVMAAGVYKLLLVDCAVARPAELAVTLVCFGASRRISTRQARGLRHGGRRSNAQMFPALCLAEAVCFL